MSDIIQVRGARQHNLKNVNIDIPRGKIVTITGVSGSGKSSLAFDTVYAEGYRKYMESLSADVRAAMGAIAKPDVDYIRGLPPVIAVEQNVSAATNPRSTLATATEIADYARIIWCVAGVQKCPHDGGEIKRRSLDECVGEILELPEGGKLYLLAPFLQGKKAAAAAGLEELKKRGWQRARANGEIFELDEPAAQKALKAENTIEIVVDRIKVGEGARSRISDSLELALKEGGGKAVALCEFGGKTFEKVLSTALSCSVCGRVFDEITPRSFSHNHPDGACPECNGIGRVMSFDERLVVPDTSKSIYGGALKPYRIGSKYLILHRCSLLKKLSLQYPFDRKAPWKDLPQDVRDFILYGDKNRAFDIRRGKSKKGEPFYFGGVLAELNHYYAHGASDAAVAKLGAYMVSSVCKACGGSRLNARSRNVFVEGKSYSDFMAMPVSAALEFVKTLKGGKFDAISEAVGGLRDRLDFLGRVGLQYLHLNREYSTLSNGEARRARLAAQLGMELVGAAYILDEPTIGLHSADNDRLIGAIKKLRDGGNSVILVEHDADAMKSSDCIVELGPKAGFSGGEVVFSGTLAECKKSMASRTGAYLSGRARIEKFSPAPIPDGRVLRVKGAREHNLKNITVDFPVGMLTVVCGVSGSGKSTLVNEILAKEAARKLNGAKELCGAHGGIEGLEYFEKCVRVDQSPIGRTPRSNPATYTKLFDKLRELFAKTPAAIARGYKASRFSFNVKGGRCEHCGGDGAVALDMQFLGDIYVQCPACKGRRYNRETLEVKYKGLDIAEALNLTVDEAAELFRAHQDIISKLKTLQDVGLGYVRLGQAANTLSGGEAQRLKLSLELSKRQSGKSLYILDEPSTGLHWDDIQKLMTLLFKLRDAGNTVIVIEHHPDIIRLADHVIELGPTGGEGGGNLIYSGDVKGLAKAKTPTAKYV
ncbi:MAG: excinuclease ABC subunit UvrA [Opitutales bacterium]|nr:excinuclease ABC subunit UvrA [Opitutales bacterium]